MKGKREAAQKELSLRVTFFVKKPGTSAGSALEPAARRARAVRPVTFKKACQTVGLGLSVLTLLSQREPHVKEITNP